MDNFKIDIQGRGKESLAKAIEIAFANNSPSGFARHYTTVRLANELQYYSNPVSKHLTPNLHNNESLHINHSETLKKNESGHLTLILCWSDSPDTIPLPYPLNANGAIGFVEGWLENAGDPGKEPDHDGDNKAGWRVFTGTWGHVSSYTYSVVAVQAIWAMYGK